MASTQAQRIHPLSEFTSTTPPGNPNVDIFATEVAALALSLQPTSISRSGTSIALVWNSGLPTAADFVLIDAAVAAHVGGAFSPDVQKAIVEAEATNDTTTEVVRATLTTGKLPAGEYQIVWSAELAVASVVANTGCQANFYVTKNGGARNERGQGVADSPLYDTRSAVGFLTIEAGDEFVFELAFKKVGGPAQTAKIQSAHIFLKPFVE